MGTIEQIHEEMAGYFRATGMTEAAAKRAAEGRNGSELRRIASQSAASTATSDTWSFMMCHLLM